MERYKCLHCGYIFSEPVHLLPERLEHFGSPCRMPGEAVCPVCGSDDFEMMHQCSVCGEWGVDLENGLCKECILSLQDRIKKFLHELSNAELESFYDLSESLYFQEIAKRKAAQKWA